MSERDGLPVDPADLSLLVQALADGELDAATALRLERHLAIDPDLAAQHARLVALRAAVKGLPRPEPSPTLRARVAAMAQPAPLSTRIGRTTARTPALFDWRALAASVLVSAALGSAGTYWLVTPPMPESFTTALASSHRRSLLAASPIDVATSDRHTVKAWLDARVGLSPPATDFAKEGFPLVGGRVEVIGDKTLPALVYRHNQHLITLIAAPRTSDAATATAMAHLSAGGFSLVHWTDAAFSYWAISDVARSDLETLAKLFQASAAGG